MSFDKCTIAFTVSHTGMIQNYVFKLLAILASMAYLLQQLTIQGNSGIVYKLVQLHDCIKSAYQDEIEKIRASGSGEPLDSLQHKKQREPVLMYKQKIYGMVTAWIKGVR